MSGAAGGEFAAALARWPWRPIANCPGRYRLAASDAASTPQHMLGREAGSREYRSALARDAVVVTPFADGGGLLSYRHADGGWLHTLNDADGLARKLAQLRIAVV